MITSLLLASMAFQLLYLFYQDWKERQIYLWSFLLLMVSMVSYSLLYMPWSDWAITNIVLNGGLLVFQLSGVWLYMSVLRRIPFTKAIGAGDIVLYIGLALIFSTPVFLVFNLSSLLLILIFWIIYQRKETDNKTQTIPLAGLQALLLLPLVIAEMFFTKGLFSPEDTRWWKILEMLV